MIAFMLYLVLVAALLGAAAAAAEAGLRLFGRSGRWVWAAALAGSLALPAVVALDRPGSGAAIDAAVGELMVVGPAQALAAPEAPAAPGRVRAALAWLAGDPIGEVAAAVAGAERATLGVWAGASALFVVYLLLGWVLLRRRRRGWRAAELDGRAVLLTAETGPAVIGFLRGEIVLPLWAGEEAPERLRMLLDHEEEHLRAGDHQLLLLALLALAAAPWNPAFWWHFLRLRRAVELDCDARVLARHGDARAYGTLLLDVGRRASRPRLLAAFSEPRSLIAHRIRAMTRRLPRWRRARALALAGLAGGAVALAIACEMPRVTEPRPRDPQPAEPVDAAVARVPAALREGPAFTPYTVAPELRNRGEVMQALERSYPPLLREAGIGGTVHVWFLLDDEGTVAHVQVAQGSGREELDGAALDVARSMRFSPALNRDVRVPVWVQLPVVFRARGMTEPLPRRAEALDTPRAEAPAVAPQLRNRADVARSLERTYPPLLREAGVGGTVEVQVLVDETGAVIGAEVARSAGNEALDSAAVRVARGMEFSPALNRGAPVPVSIRLPIVFGARGVSEPLPLRPEAPAAAPPMERPRTERPRTEPPRSDAPPLPRPADVAERPTFTPYTTPPELRNRPEVAETLRRHYPPLLREAGIGGTVTVWFYIDEQGTVQRTRIVTPGTRPELDAAALQIGEAMRFSPARHRDRPVGVWVQLPIVFQP
jgi:TonB family protein